MKCQYRFLPPIYADLQAKLQREETRVQTLEEEKTTWLSHGVQAEFKRKQEVRNVFFYYIYKLIQADP